MCGSSDKLSHSSLNRSSFCCPMTSQRTILAMLLWETTKEDQTVSFIRLTTYTLALGIMSLATLGQATADELAGPAIKQAVSGKIIHVSTPVGTLPIAFGSNGTMRARSSAIARLTGIAKDKGRWWIKGGKLCQKWKTWLKGKAHCVSVRRQGKKLVWTSTSGRTGVARISSN